MKDNTDNTHNKTPRAVRPTHPDNNEICRFCGVLPIGTLFVYRDANDTHEQSVLVPEHPHNKAMLSALRMMYPNSRNEIVYPDLCTPFGSAFIQNWLCERGFPHTIERCPVTSERTVPCDALVPVVTVTLRGGTVRRLVGPPTSTGDTEHIIALVYAAMRAVYHHERDVTRGVTYANGTVQ